MTLTIAHSKTISIQISYDVSYLTFQSIFITRSSIYLEWINRTGIDIEFVPQKFNWHQH